MLLLLVVLLVVGPVFAANINVGVVARLTELGVVHDQAWTDDQVARVNCALLAAKHFNQRNNTIVDFAQFSTCPHTINPIVADSRASEEYSVRAFQDMTPRPAAIVGPNRSSSAGPLAIIAGIETVPVISFSATSATLDSKATFPYFARTVPSDKAVGISIVSLFLQLGFSTVTIFYSRDSYGIALQTSIADEGEKAGLNATPIGYEVGDEASMDDGLAAIAKNGKRAIVGVVLLRDLETIILKAKALNISGPGSFWLFTDAVGTSYPETITNPDVINAMHGSAVVLAVGGSSQNAAWNSLKRAWPYENVADYNQYLPPNSTLRASYFTETSQVIPDVCSFSFDCMAMIAFAACEQNTTGGNGLLNAIAAQSFEGVTGLVELNSELSREPETANFLVYNVLKNSTTGRLKSIYSASWKPSLGEFVFDKQFEFSVGPGKPFYDTCSLGTVYNKTTFVCSPCPAGFANDGTYTQCQACEPGSVTPQAGSATCISCNVWQDTFSAEPGQTKCVLCPQRTRRAEGTSGTNVTDCHCAEGSYHPDQTIGEPCYPCPDHATCAGGLALPAADEGYWGRMDYFENYWKCPSGVEGCAGGEESLCKEGYKNGSRLCAACAADYFKFGNYCYSCSYPSAVRWLVLFVLLLWFPTQKFLAMRVTKAFYVYYPFLQTLTTISRFNLGWSVNVANAMTGLSIVNFNLDVTQIACTSFFGFKTLWTAYMSLPVVFGVLFAIRVIICHVVWPKHAAEVTRKSFGAWAFYLNSLYLMLFGKSIDVLVCQEYGPGLNLLRVDPARECDSTGDLATAGWIFLVFYGAGVPFMIGLVLWRWKRSTHPGGPPLPNFLKSCYFLWKRFEPEYFYWELIVILRKILLIIILKVFFRNGIVQAILGLVVIYCAGLAQFYARPFVDTKHDILDSTLFTCQFAIILVGIMFYMKNFNNKLLEYLFFIPFSIAVTLSAGLSVHEALTYMKVKGNKLRQAKLKHQASSEILWPTPKLPTFNTE